jgi:hypothetical protein
VKFLEPHPTLLEQFSIVPSQASRCGRFPDSFRWECTRSIKVETMANSWLETMAPPTQYDFELREVAAALVKQQDIHEGRWWAVFEFVLRSGVFGQTDAELLPGGLFQIKRIVLAHPDLSTPEQFVVDAAEVNPAPSLMASVAGTKK